MAEAQNVGLTSAHGGENTLDEVATTVIMARVTDFFGFFVYALASVLVFPWHFFPNYDPTTGLMLSFAVFSLAFLARPIASIGFRPLERKIGRIGKITVALFLLGGSTIAIGLLPGYKDIGWVAPALLVLFRIGQGLGLGGAWDGLTLLLQTSAPKEKRGWYAMIPQLGAPIGFIIAAAIFYVLTGFLTAEEFSEWGWRWPFFAVLAVNVVALFARIRLIQSADLEALKEKELLKGAPLRELIQIHWRELFWATLIPLCSYAIFHMVTVFPLGYISLFTERSVADFLVLQMAGGAICLVTVALSGVITDRMGKLRYFLFISLAIAVFSFLVIDLSESGVFFIIIGFALFGFSYGQANVISPDRFELKYRYSGNALSNNLAWIAGAAFAPLVALSVTSLFGLQFAGLYLMSGAVVSALAVFSSRSGN